MSEGWVQVRAALVGDFGAEVEAGRRSVVQAIGLSMEELADGLVDTLRHDFTASGLRGAGRLRGAAWRKKVYGAGRSLEPAAQIFSKLPIIVQAFENGQTIRARGASGLLIPNPDVWPGGRVRLARNTAGSLWEVATARFGPLQVVRRPGKTTLVVATVRESQGARGGYRKASAGALGRLAAGRASGLVTIVVFVIAKQATQPRLLRSREIKARTARDAPRRLDSLFQKNFQARTSGPHRLAAPTASSPTW